MLLSLPAWTPGAYEITNFARWVSDFTPTAGGRPLAWDKLDYDTWRIQPAGAKAVTVTLRLPGRHARQRDGLGQAGLRACSTAPTCFLYPEGRGFDFPATVTDPDRAGWLVATGMAAGAEQPGPIGETNYHDLVDKPVLRRAVRLRQHAGGRPLDPTRHLSAGALTGPARALLWDQIGKMIPAEAAVFQETPWRDYTVMMIFDSRATAGGSALEHANSHVGIYSPQLHRQRRCSPRITAHEIFHAWNVKRLRPADMCALPLRPARAHAWLWVSEGITDYYADLALVRGGIVDSTVFLDLTAEQDRPRWPRRRRPRSRTPRSPPGSIPTDGSRYLYYPKGSLAGFMLDILIRDASDNRHSLDDVMRELYRADYKKGRGFTAADWWRTVSRPAGGRSFTDFDAKYVDGREPFPWADILPLAGLRLATDTVRAPQVGIGDDPGHRRQRGHHPRSSRAAWRKQAGVKQGDRLIALGDVAINDSTFDASFRRSFGRSEGDTLRIKVLRGRDTLTLNGKIRLVDHTEEHLEADATASPKAARIRAGLFRGRGS